MLIYLDSLIVIYYLDQVGPFQLRAARRITAAINAGDRFVFSDLTRLECRLLPIRVGDAQRLSRIDGFFLRRGVELAPLTTAVYDRATVIRADYNFKTPDALHLAAAVEAGCDLFLTNDTRLGRFAGLPIEILP